MGDILSANLLGRSVSWGSEVTANLGGSSATIRPSDPISYAYNNQITEPYAYPQAELNTVRTHQTTATPTATPTIKSPPVAFSFDPGSFFPDSGGSSPFDPTTGVPNDPYNGGCSNPFDLGCLQNDGPPIIPPDRDPGGYGGGLGGGPFDGSGALPVGLGDDISKGFAGIADRYTGVVKNLLLGALAIAVIAIAIFAMVK